MSSYLVSQPLPTIKDLQQQIAALQSKIEGTGNSLFANVFRGELLNKQNLLNALLYPDRINGIPPAPAAPPTLAPRPQTPRVGLSDLVIGARSESPTIPSPATAPYSGSLIPVRGY